MKNRQVTIEYKGGLDTAKDDAIERALSKVGGTWAGSGCLLMDPYPRDITAEVPAGRIGELEDILPSGVRVFRH